MKLLARNYDVTVRYRPAADIIRTTDPGWTVLDVGAGVTGIRPFLDRPVTCVDCEPGSDIRASATDLPFPDRSWDIVTCIDVLEHLPPQDREKAIRELFRVARNVVILACPCGHEARAADVAMQAAYERAGTTPPAWLGEHLAHPHPNPVDVAYVAYGAGKAKGMTVSGWWNESLGLQRIHRFLAVRNRYAYKAFSVLCSFLPVSPRKTGYRQFIVAQATP